MARATAASQLTTERGLSFVPAWAGPRDDEALRRLLRETPMPGRIRIALEREPDFFHAAQLEWERNHTAVAREPVTGEIFAMCSRSVRTLFLNGAPVPLGYLSQLRILPGRRAHKLKLLKMGFEWLATTHEPLEAPFDVTTVVEENSPAWRLLTARLPGLPIYSELEPMVTFLLPVSRPRACRSSEVIRGRSSMSSEIVGCLQRFGRRHQFAPCWTVSDFHPRPAREATEFKDFFVSVHGDKVAGCVAVLDQRSYKQVVVRGYSGMLTWTRPVLNILGAGFPACGSVLPVAWLAPLAVDDDAPEVFTSLVNAVMTELHGRSDIQWLALMLAARHPLAPLARRFSARSYRSRLFAVHAAGTQVNLDDRVTYLEGALL